MSHPTSDVARILSEVEALVATNADLWRETGVLDALNDHLRTLRQRSVLTRGVVLDPAFVHHVAAQHGVDATMHTRVAADGPTSRCVLATDDGAEEVYSFDDPATSRIDWRGRPFVYDGRRYGGVEMELFRDGLLTRVRVLSVA